MSLKLMAVEDLMKVANCGGGFRLPSATRPTDELLKIATSAKYGGGTVTFTGMRVRPLEDLMKIATNGGGHVVFEDDD